MIKHTGTKKLAGMILLGYSLSLSRREATSSASRWLDAVTRI
jgi:hypothetical protein